MIALQQPVDALLGGVGVAVLELGGELCNFESLTAEVGGDTERKLIGAWTKGTQQCAEGILVLPRLIAQGVRLVVEEDDAAAGLSGQTSDLDQGLTETILEDGRAAS